MNELQLYIVSLIKLTFNSSEKQQYLARSIEFCSEKIVFSTANWVTPVALTPYQSPEPGFYRMRVLTKRI